MTEHEERKSLAERLKVSPPEDQPCEVCKTVIPKGQGYQKVSVAHNGMYLGAAWLCFDCAFLQSMSDY